MNYYNKMISIILINIIQMNLIVKIKIIVKILNNFNKIKTTVLKIFI